MEHFFEILWHAVKDTLPLLPWILLMYVLIELLNAKSDLKRANQFNGKYGPMLGAATGLIPQCGFSVMAAKLFEQKYITLGTLMAIFLSTSDEAFIILLSSFEGAAWVLPTLLVKIVVAVVVGYAIDLLFKAIGRGQVCVEMPEKKQNATKTVRDIFIKNYQDEKDVDVVCSCGRTHGDGVVQKYVVSPLIHTLKVAAFILIVNFVFAFIVHEVGEDAFVQFMHRSRFVQPLITCAVGLIPNCASSVVITEAFLSGGIAFGSFVAGLCANAGMGFVVLLKNVRKWKRNLALVGVCYGISVAVGLALNVWPMFI